MKVVYFKPCIYPAHSWIYRRLNSCSLGATHTKGVSSVNNGIVHFFFLGPLSSKSSILGRVFTTYGRPLIKKTDIQKRKTNRQTEQTKYTDRKKDETDR